MGNDSRPHSYGGLIWCVGVIVAAAILGLFYVRSQSDKHKTQSDKKGTSAPMAERMDQKEVLLSAEQNLFPTVEYGDSGDTMVLTESGTLLEAIKDAGLAIARETNQVKVSALIRDKRGIVVAELLNNEWKVNPQSEFDRNYTSNALEVLDSSGDVMLQVKALPDRIQMQCKMYSSSDRGAAMGKLFLNGKWIGIFDFIDPKVHPGRTNMPMKLNPMFKYPSKSHLGELAARSQE